MKLIMVMVITMLIGFLSISSSALANRTSPLIIDHRSTNIDQIPESAIASAKAALHIAYQHSSHGSQIISGMNALRSFPEFGAKFNWGDTPDDNAILDLHDNAMPKAVDLSEGEYKWYDATRTYLNDRANANVNVIMWSWCDIKGHDIDYYLDRMEALIEEYGEGSTLHPVPVQFIFMTGHANGGGEGDSSDAQNQLIRQHCITNNRILFDFADIENYDPDNQYYLDKKVDDALYYDSDGDGTKDRNWASEYLAAHPNSQLFHLVNGTAGYNGCGNCLHSPEKGETNDAKLNCVLKGRAAWWLWARLAGWGECLPAPSKLSAEADTNHQNITLSWVDNTVDINEDSFIIQRRVNDAPWENAFAQVSADTTIFTDSNLAPGSYRYRILARQNDAGNGEPCDSLPSNEIVAVISDGAPAAPASLVAQVNENDVHLTWNDNSNDEEQFILERKTNNGEFSLLAQIGPNITTYTDTEVSLENAYTYRVMASNSAADSAYSNEAQTFNANLLTPKLLTPPDGSSDISLSPTLSSSEYQDPNSDGSHVQTIWQISTKLDFTSLVHNETADNHLTKLTVSQPLEKKNTYYWRVSYLDSRGAQSNWSDAFSFTTGVQDQKTDSDSNGKSSGGSSGCFIEVTTGSPN